MPSLLSPRTLLEGHFEDWRVEFFAERGYIRAHLFFQAQPTPFIVQFRKPKRRAQPRQHQYYRWGRFHFLDMSPSYVPEEVRTWLREHHKEVHIKARILGEDVHALSN